jgi:hypothetical protein
VIDQPSRSSRPAVAVKNRAVSATVRANGPRWVNSSATPSGTRGIRPNVDFRPTTPQKLAGMRIDPPSSVPTAKGPIPAATAAPAPPLEPPQVWAVDQGLRVTPKSGLSVKPLWANSGVVVLPSRIAPAALRRATITASSVGTKSA